MKMFFIKSTVVVATVLLFNACGSDMIESIKIKPLETEVSGDLNGYLEVVSSEYEMVGDYMTELSIKVKAIRAMSDEELEKKDVTLAVILLNEQGMPVSGVNDLDMSFENKKSLLNLLKKGKGEIVISFTGYDQLSEDIKKFTVSSALKTLEEEGNDDELSSESNGGNENLDQVLDDYEKYVDQYLIVYKKMKKGDAAAMEEYTDLLEKTKELQESLDKAESDSEMSKDQLSRMMKIQTKMAKAAM